MERTLYYGFRTSERDEAVAALLVYAIYRSREPGRLKVTPDFWGQIERAVKSAAKRAADLGSFIERLKPKLGCSTIHPRFAKTVPDDVISLVPDPATGGFIEYGDRGRGEPRQFLTELLEDVPPRGVLEVLYKKTSLTILLVRDRIEREKPIESVITEKAKEEQV